MATAGAGRNTELKYHSILILTCRAPTQVVIEAHLFDRKDPKKIHGLLEISGPDPARRSRSDVIQPELCGFLFRSSLHFLLCSSATFFMSGTRNLCSSTPRSQNLPPIPDSHAQRAANAPQKRLWVAMATNPPMNTAPTTEATIGRISPIT